MDRKDRYLNHLGRNKEGPAVDLIKQKENNIIEKYLDVCKTFFIRISGKMEFKLILQRVFQESQLLKMGL
jgi:hypothetical protein